MHSVQSVYEIKGLGFKMIDSYLYNLHSNLRFLYNSLMQYR